jgi:hypothetical protein
MGLILPRPVTAVDPISLRQGLIPPLWTSQVTAGAGIGGGRH